MNPETTRLFLLRHAIAEDRDQNIYPDDAIRPLSSKGRKKMIFLAESIHRLGFSFDMIISSPYLRAKQTAEIAAGALHLGNRLFFSDHLIPTGSTRSLLRDLSEQNYIGKTILLVGHEPYLSTLISVLCTGDERAEVRLKKGGLCYLTSEALSYNRCATLEWLLTPSLLMRML